MPIYDYKCSSHDPLKCTIDCYRKCSILDIWNDQEDMQLKDMYYTMYVYRLYGTSNS